MTDAERVQAVLETACRQGRADKVAQGVAAMEAVYLDTIGTRLRVATRNDVRADAQ